MIEIYATKIMGKIEKPIYDMLMAYLTYDKQEMVKRFHRPEDAQRMLVADILVRVIVCEKLGLKNKDLAFYKNEYGKPFLTNSDRFYFNVSHSGEWVICAAHNMPVGADIEIVQSIDYEIAKRFFSEHEYNDLMQKDALNRLSYFYDLWTLKESYIKAAGKGLSIPLDSFSIKKDRNGITIETENEFRNCYFTQYYIDSNYKVAVCGCENCFSNEVIFNEVDDLNEEMKRF